MVEDIEELGTELGIEFLRPKVELSVLDRCEVIILQSCGIELVTPFVSNGARRLELKSAGIVIARDGMNDSRCRASWIRCDGSTNVWIADDVWSF